MNDIFKPYAIFAIIVEVDNIVKRRFLTGNGRGATRKQNAAI